MIRWRRGISFILLSVLLILVIPPARWVARDLWLLAQPETAQGRLEARWIILQDAVRGADRAREAQFLVPPPPPPAAGARPVIEVSPSPPNLATAIPTCADRRFRAVPAGAGRDPRYAIPSQFRRPLRWSDLEGAKLQLIEAKSSTFRLVALSACVNATPFASRCARSLRPNRGEDQAGIIGVLERTGALRRDGGRVCWAWPEFVE